MLQALDKCQLGDEVRKKEGKLDSIGLILQLFQKNVFLTWFQFLSCDIIVLLSHGKYGQAKLLHFLMFPSCSMILNFFILRDIRAGLIEEYDSPSRLLENKSSSFAQLVAEYTMRSSSSSE
ncbi:hypothetical protein FEM48_Zijuj01G0249000 [Ziziphus jujuba var. spinosa]|uniref:Uncharacterized protein n=1 Tax=Ziziphus jujuba var. spinosa TaxID=714518 RepID=A0A978W4K8_ZIZJJ|nr:hypothetical protein FEM48_Zijuj01G0249000 [Ziziphus jujuba var. spinosa]